MNDTRQSIIRDTFKFWDALNDREKRLLLDNAMLVSYEKGETIHSGDADCIGILILITGELRTFLLSEDGREVTLFRLKGRDVCVLSASCILQNITFDVHIDAVSRVEAILINANVFQELCVSNINFENFSYKIAADKFSDVMWAMQQILFLSFDKRLAIFLIDESAQTGLDHISLTHEQISKLIGSAREVVSRMLKYFENEGMVKLSRGGVTIIDKKKLRELTI
jgi:CRP/FNR family transcriptional regulator